MIPPRPRWARRLVAPILLLSSHQALAADYLAAEPFVGKKVHVDGALLEWPGGFARLTEKVSGSATDAQALVAYDETYVYLAAKVKDTKLARSAQASPTEDHLTLELYFPGRRGQGTTHQIDVFPGNPGKLPAVVKVDGKTSGGAEAVEAPEEGGVVIEARVPWASLPEAQSVRVGLRGKLTYSDFSAPGQPKGVVSTSRAQGKSMPSLTLESETGLIQSLLEPKGLSLTPAREAYGDVSGDGRWERVALFDHFLSICGPGYRDGKQFYFNELEVDRADKVTRLELVDLNGDGKAEIVIGKKLGDDRAYREIVQALQIGADGAPLLVFSHEVSIVTAEGRIENKFSIEGEGKSARLIVAQGKSSGFAPDSYQEPQIGGGIGSALLPWQSVGSQIYAWKGQGVTLLEETSFTPKARAAAKSAGAAAAPAVKAPPPPRPPSADEMLDRVYALYRQDRGVGNKKPRFDFVTDVTGDEQPERVLVHDKDIVMFGKGFKGGLSYTSITMGVKEPKDVLAVTARDLTGDGKAEIIVHAVLNAQASKQLGGDIVARQALFVYSIENDALTRIFAAETARSLKGNRIIGGLRFVPTKSGLAIETTPLLAVGWTEKTYPFPEDQTAAGGLEPLLLPWGGKGPSRYEFDGKTYVAH